MSAIDSQDLLEAHADVTGEVFVQQSTIAIRDEPAEWTDRCQQHLVSLAELEPNWDSYGAQRVDPRSIEAGKALIGQLARYHGIEEPSTTASPDGYVVLSWDREDRSLDAEILPDAIIAYAYMDRQDRFLDREGKTNDPAFIANLLTQW